MSSEKKALHTFGAVAAYGTADDDQIFFYKSVMKVDADGAPNAIGPHVIYVLFPGSGAGRPLTVDQINGMGRAAFNVWGGFPRLWELFPEEFLGDYVVPPGIAAMA